MKATRTLRVPVEGLAAGRQTLDRETSHYLLRVHRLRQGARFLAFDPRARIEAEGSLLEVVAGEAVCAFDAPRAAMNVPPWRVLLIQAVAKGDKLDRVIRDATALGAAQIVLAQTERSVAELGGRAARRLDRFRTIALDAARQSGRADLPALEGPVPLEQALSSLPPDAHKLCLDPGASEGFGDRISGWRPDQPLVVLIGPEGGLAPGELSAAAAAGFHAVQLGRFVLRTELAGAAVLGAIVAHADGLAHTESWRNPGR
ncbi:MAG TPA: RsmE family RNA methyltransferase [Polyangiaceae bacterium]|nr:RsmE family RNA methyltransferase [Polyangiaceae bacterium]